MKRICANFDDESLEILNQYLVKYKGSTAHLLRMALQSLKNCEELQEKVPWKNVAAYVDYMGSMEHLIIDIADGQAIFSAIGEGSDKFWKEIYKIGEEHLNEYFDKGLRTVKEILEYVEFSLCLWLIHGYL